MTVCINPQCPQPENNPNGTKYCQSCGQPVPDKLINRFQLTKVLGQGGFGRTYLAKDTQRRNSLCVVKQLIANYTGTQANQRVTELFDREAAQLEILGEHPRIPRLVAYFQENSCLYLAQEYIQGEDLAQELKAKGVWNEDKIRQLLGELLPVIQFIHENKVIHRDLKPANIMRRSTSTVMAKKGDLILIDFGVSKDLSASVQQTIDKSIAGTNGYAPLEQMALGEVYPASDLYSLGVICFQLLTNENPYFLFLDKGYSWSEKYQDYLPSNISDNLNQVLGKLLQKDCQQRYQLAREVIQALEVSSPQQNIVSTVLTPTKVVSPQNSQQNPILSSLPVEVETQGKVTAKPKKKSGLKIFEFETVTVKIEEIKTSVFIGCALASKSESKANYKKHQGQAKYFTENLENGITLDMVEIPGGTFMMGTRDEEIERLVEKYDRGWFSQEKPQHQVTVKPFFMGKYPITQAQWQAVANLPKINRELKPNPAEFKGNNRPVESVSWYDAVEFCARLSKLTGKQYKLPSEAQWEYACRAGSTTPFYFGETITSELANYYGTETYANEPKGEYRRGTTPVGSFPPNGFGLYDMHGNVWEWCEDTWHNSYEGAPTDDSAWIDKDIDNNSELSRLMRGGSWDFNPEVCRSALRGGNDPAGVFYFNIGFRVCCGVLRSLE